MKILNRFFKIFVLKTMNIAAYLYPPFKENLRFFTLRAALYAGYCRQKGFVTGDNEKLLISHDVRAWIGNGASIILKKTTFESWLRPPNSLYPEAIGIGVEWEKRFIPFPQRGRSVIDLKKDAVLELESGVYILPGVMLRARDGTFIRIGAGSCLAHNVTINTKCGLSIGRYVLIGQGALIMDYDGHPVWGLNDEKSSEVKGEPITIEDNVWIGMRAMILKGVKISEGSIVGAGAVVTRDVPPHSVVAGNPARVVKEGIQWSVY